MDDGGRWFEPAPGARMPWMVLGRPDGPDVVALPGLSDGLMPLSEVGPHVVGPPRGARRRVPFRVVTLSHRHPVEVGTTTRELARDAAAFVEAQRDGPVVVVGHSMGGMVAQWLAADRPDLVRELVLTATLARPVDTFVDQLRAWEAMVVDGRWRAFAAAANEAAYTGSELLRRRLFLRLTRPPAAPHLVDRHRALTAACLEHDATSALERIACPGPGPTTRSSRRRPAAPSRTGSPGRCTRSWRGSRTGSPSRRRNGPSPRWRATWGSAGWRHDAVVVGVG